jgi:hypothetical protein
MLAALENAVESGDAKAVERAIFDLGSLPLAQGLLDDELAFGILALLKRSGLATSPIAAHLLNFFEFESPRISQLAKDRCSAFLQEYGDMFSHIHSQQVVTELRHGAYLKPQQPEPPRKKPRHSPS